MRVAYISADLGVPVFGSKGSSVHVQEIIRAFRNQRADVELFAARLGGQPPADLRDLRIHALPPIDAADNRRRERESLQANRRLRRMLRDRGPFDLIYERYSLWSFAGMAFARDTGAPGLLEVNAPLIEEQASYRTLGNRALAERVARKVFATADRVIAVSREVADHLERFADVAGRICVIPNGVDINRFSPTSASNGRFTVGFVGTLKPWHGVAVLLQAFDRVCRTVPNARLLIVGDGPERASLEESIGRMNLANVVEFTGAVAPLQVPKFCSDMDVAVARYPGTCSFYFSPLKVLEYMASGRAVVASRIGQIVEWIDHGVNGLLVPPGDHRTLAAAINDLAKDRALRTRLGVAARETVCRRHTWDIAAQRILSCAGRHSNRELARA